MVGVLRSYRGDHFACFPSHRHGVIFKLTLVSGKVIQPYSYFESEEEVLVSPQSRFVVSSAPYVGTDGYAYVDMVEQNGTVFLS